MRRRDFIRSLVAGTAGVFIGGLPKAIGMPEPEFTAGSAYWTIGSVDYPLRDNESVIVMRSTDGRTFEAIGDWQTSMRALVDRTHFRPSDRAMRNWLKVEQ